MNGTNQQSPKLVGLWVVAVMGGGDDVPELVKWGLDGDTEFPFPPAQEVEALAQARYIDSQEQYGRVYILHVFSNGQVKQFDFDE